MREKTIKTKKKKSAFSVMKKVFNVLGVLLILLLMALCIFLIYQRVTGQEPKLFGYRLFEVQTGSMEPTIMTGDTILTREYKKNEEIKLGDIVVFKNDQIWINVGKPELKGNYIVHRVVSIDKENNTIITLGDNNHGISDPSTPVSAVEAKYVTKFSGGFFRFIRSPFGIIAIIAALIAIFAAMRLIYALNVKRKKKKILESTASSENGDTQENEKSETDETSETRKSESASGNVASEIEIETPKTDDGNKNEGTDICTDEFKKSASEKRGSEKKKRFGRKFGKRNTEKPVDEIAEITEEKSIENTEENIEK